MEQELPLQSFCKFHGLQGRPRFCHITTVKNGPLYFWGFALFQVAILLKCVLMSGCPLCRGQLFLKLTKNKKCTEKKWLGALNLYSKHLAKFVAGSSFWWVPLTTQSQISLYKMGTPKLTFGSVCRGINKFQQSKFPRTFLIASKMKNKMKFRGSLLPNVLKLIPFGQHACDASVTPTAAVVGSF